MPSCFSFSSESFLKTINERKITQRFLPDSSGRPGRTPFDVAHRVHHVIAQFHAHRTILPCRRRLAVQVPSI
jgi:hypothetical protein